MSKLEVVDIDSPSGESVLTLGGINSNTVKVSGGSVEIGKSGGSVTISSGASVTGFGGISGIQTFTSSGTWTKGAGVTKVIVEVQGAGGGGNNGAASVRTYPACASATDGTGFFAPVFDGAVLIVFLAILALHQFCAAVKPVHERRGQ